MNKLLLKFLLAFCFLLLSAHGGAGGEVHGSVLKSVGSSLYSDTGILNIDKYTETPDFSALYKARERVETSDNENKEDKLRASKKPDSGDYFLTSFYPQVPGYFCQYCKNSLRSSSYVFDFISHRRHILFRVLRI